MKSERVAIRAGIGIALAIAVFVVVFGFVAWKHDVMSAAALMAAALAVITSALSTWGNQKSLEIQEDRVRPYPYPYVDLRSRLYFALLRVENFGLTTAHNIHLDWDEPLLNEDGQPVRFRKVDGGPEIQVLLPGKSVSMKFGRPFKLLEQSDLTHQGRIRFEDPNGREYQHRFTVTLEQDRHGLTYDEERLKMERKLQDVPEELKSLREEIHRIRCLMERAGEGPE